MSLYTATKFAGNLRMYSDNGWDAHWTLIGRSCEKLINNCVLSDCTRQAALELMQACHTLEEKRVALIKAIEENES